jgi:hypothetical protein
VNVSQGVFYPDWWRMALARSYLAHQDLNSLITILFVVSRKVIKTVRVSRLFILASNPLLRIRDPVHVGLRIRDKNPGSATLLKSELCKSTYCAR